MAIGDFFKDNTSEGNAKRREMIGSLGRDALRQMNPFRDSTPAPQPQPTGQQSVSMNENAQPGSAARTARQNPALNVMPAPSHSPVRMNTLSGNQQSASPTVGQQPTYALNATGAVTNPLASGVLANRSLRAGRELVTPSNQVTDAQSGMLGQGGIRYEKQADGSTTYSMGQRGSGNYASLNRQPANPLARNALAANVPQVGQQTRQVGGLTVTGSQDAVNRLAAPVGTYDRNSPEYNQAQAQNYQKANPFSQNNPYDDRFSYRPPQGSDSPLIAPPHVAMGGGGWKSRIEADRSNAAAYGDYARALSSLQGAAVQERGANYRAGLQQQGVVEQNDIARKRLMGDLSLNDARIAGEGVNTQKGQMEVEQAKKMQALNDQYLAEQDPVKQKNLGNQILTMQGKNSKDWQITTREEPLDPSNPMAGTTKRPYAVNLNDPNQVIELGGQGGGAKYDEAPMEAGSRKKGSVYNTPKGPLKWTGDGWTDEF